MSSLIFDNYVVEALLERRYDLVALGKKTIVADLLSIQERISNVSSESDERRVHFEVEKITKLLLETDAADMVRAIIQKATNAQFEDINKGFSMESFGTGGSSAGEFAEPPSVESAAPEAMGDDNTTAEKSINAWIPGHEPTQSLELDKKYELLFRVGDPVSISFIGGDDSKIALAEIPENGLETEWVVNSSSGETGPYAADDKIPVETVTSEMSWTSKFQLLIPRQGNSETVRLSLIPRQVNKLELDVLIYTWIDRPAPLDAHDQRIKELYRQFQVKLQVHDQASPTTPTNDPVNLVQNEIVHSPASQLHLIPPHEWCTPPGELNIHVISNGQALVSGDAGNNRVEMITQWNGVSALVSGPITNLISSAEKFRAKWDAYLNDIDGNEIGMRLGQFIPNYDWRYLHFHTSPAHDQSWQAVAASPELQNLAIEGYTLYEVFFPTGSPLRAVMDSLIPGEKINISWLPSSGPGYVPHVPWGLLYTKLPDGGPVEAECFMGLRYRINYTSREIQNASKALGKQEKAYSANLFYWDNQPGDPVYTEAAWQQKQFTGLQLNQVFVPGTAGSSAKTELVGMLNKPAVSPLALLYLFCHCSVGDGNTPVLRFGASPAPEYLVKHTELGLTPFADRPLVFANACTTAAAEPYMANELEAAFFRRQCRAYIGTEIKVPIAFASRFAFIFFNFFYRKVAPEPMAGGEAIAQSRLWLWTNYRNIGGLFYSYVNQYDLFMADADEVQKLR